VKDKLNRFPRALVAASLGAAYLVVCVAAYASEEAAEGAESAGAMDAILPKMSEFIPALAAFLVVFFILSKFAWPAITGMLDQRADTIRESLERAEEAKMEGERLLGEYRATMAESRKEAAAILAQAKQAGEAMRADSAAKAQEQYDDMLAKARVAIQGEKQAALAELQTSVAELSVAVAGRLIGADLSTDEHLKIVEKYVKEAGSLNAN